MICGETVVFLQEALANVAGVAAEIKNSPDFTLLPKAVWTGMEVLGWNCRCCDKDKSFGMLLVKFLDP